MSRLKSGMQFFLTELHAQNYRFQLCAFLKFGKISEITSGVEILLNRSRRSKQFCGKIPGRSANVPKKDFTSDVSKSCWKDFIRFFMPMSRLSNGCSVLLL